MDITDYRVISAEQTDVLRSKVNEAIVNGWQPQGGVTIHNSGSKIIAFYQAMVKESK